MTELRLYRTIMADPPWDYPEGFSLGYGHGQLERRPLPYAAMTVEQIRMLPVADLAEQDARLFLWTTNRYLPDAFGVIEAWGFIYRQTLTWNKLDANLPASVAPNSEFLLVATRGNPKRLRTLKSAVIAAHTHSAWNSKGHSRKPECFLDHIEQVSPGPYVELFARRDRLGWDTYGDESLGTAGMPECDRCGRVTPTSYMPEYGANFCEPCAADPRADPREVPDAA